MSKKVPPQIEVKKVRSIPIEIGKLKVGDTFLVPNVVAKILSSESLDKHFPTKCNDKLVVVEIEGPGIAKGYRFVIDKRAKVGVTSKVKRTLPEKLADVGRKFMAWLKE